MQEIYHNFEADFPNGDDDSEFCRPNERAQKEASHRIPVLIL